MAAEETASKNETETAGWPLLVGLGVAQIVSWGTIYYGFALLLQPLQRALGAGQGVIVGAYSVALLAAGIGAPWVGRAIDRGGGRAVMTAGSLLAALSFAALAYVESVALLYVVWLALGIAMAATLYEPAFAVVTQAFGPRYRRAITVLTLFGGFASTVFWPATAALIERFGWRDAVLFLAAFNLFINVPLHALLLPRGRPRTSAQRGPATTAAPTGTTAFIALAVALLAQAIAISALAVHFLPLLVARDMTPVAAAAVGALIGPMQVLGRIVEAAVSPRASAVAVGRVVVLMLPAALLTLYGAGTNALLLGLYVVLYGAGNGAMTIVRGAVPVELWGREHYGALMGWLATPAMLARASGPFLASLLWTWAGGYDVVLLVLAAIAVAAAVAFHVAVARRRP